MNTNVETISINGVSYVRADSVATHAKPGKRAVIVADRGWVFCGDVTDENGRIKLARAVHVRSWSGIGFDGMISTGGKGDKVVVKSVSDIDMPADSELFRVPVGDNWGLP
jgi:hypothetical protein